MHKVTALAHNSSWNIISEQNVLVKANIPVSPWVQISLVTAVQLLFYRTYMDPTGDVMYKRKPSQT